MVKKFTTAYTANVPHSLTFAIRFMEDSSQGRNSLGFTLSIPPPNGRIDVRCPFGATSCKSVAALKATDFRLDETYDNEND